MPVGNLFVVPRDFRSFAANLELRLYVNDRLRQRSMTQEMIWDVDEIFAQTWARRALGWGESIPSHAISAYLEDARSAAAYLQPGDQVVIHVDYLGAIQNEVTR